MCAQEADISPKSPPSSTQGSVVCIIGRPNVGKSTLFNRILGRRHAIVHDEAGTTVDRIVQHAEIHGRHFRLIDTGGFVPKAARRIDSFIATQITAGIAAADILVFVCDAQAGLCPLDEDLVRIARQSAKPLFLVINKVDNDRVMADISDFYRLGIDAFYPVSAMHNRGMEPFLEDLAKGLHPGTDVTPTAERPVRIAVVGRPNVGKSSFVNAVLDEERVLVDAEPGTTRDIVDTPFLFNGAHYLLIDTAGIRHKRKVKRSVDVFAVARSQEAIRRSDVSVVVLDGFDGLRVDDIRVLDMAWREGKGCVIAVNKWDLVKGVDQGKYLVALERRLPMVRFVPIRFISALKRSNVQAVLKDAQTVWSRLGRRIPTPEVNRIVRQIKDARKAPVGSNHRTVTVYYMTQVSVNPASFVVFVNNRAAVSDQFSRYLENLVRERFDLKGVPLMISFRDREHRPRGKKKR